MTSAVFQCFYDGGNVRLIALALADACADESGAGIFLAVATVAQMADVNRSTVQRTMARLLADGWLLRDGGNVGGRGRTNTYNINPDWITAVAVERARARQAGQRAGKVMPPAPRAPADGEGDGPQEAAPTDAPVKGGKLPPFIKPESRPPGAAGQAARRLCGACGWCGGHGGFRWAPTKDLTAPAPPGLCHQLVRRVKGSSDSRRSRGPGSHTMTGHPPAPWRRVLRTAALVRPAPMALCDRVVWSMGLANTKRTTCTWCTTHP